MIPVFRVITVAVASMPPADPRQCPTIDLIPLIGMAINLFWGWRFGEKVSGIIGTAAAALAFLNWYSGAPPFGRLLEDGAWWIWPFILGGLGAWWWWVFEDWRNDEYRLTGNRVIEINRTPFSLNEQRRESPLSDFQSTELKVVGPWQKMFRYGTLIVKLPGAQVEFKDIVNPAGAQTEITKRLNAYNAQRAEKEAQARRNELTDWFAAYDEIRQRFRIHHDRHEHEQFPDIKLLQLPRGQHVIRPADSL